MYQWQTNQVFWQKQEADWRRLVGSTGSTISTRSKSAKFCYFPKEDFRRREKIRKCWIRVNAVFGAQKRPFFSSVTWISRKAVVQHPGRVHWRAQATEAAHAVRRSIQGHRVATAWIIRFFFRLRDKLTSSVTLSWYHVAAFSPSLSYQWQYSPPSPFEIKKPLFHHFLFYYCLALEFKRHCCCLALLEERSDDNW